MSVNRIESHRTDGFDHAWWIRASICRGLASWGFNDDRFGKVVFGVTLDNARELGAMLRGPYKDDPIKRRVVEEQLQRARAGSGSHRHAEGGSSS